MKKRVYLSVLLMALLLVAVVAIFVATGTNDLDVAGEATERDPAAAGLFPANSAGDLPPSGGYSGDDAYDPAVVGVFPANSAGDLPPGGLATSGGRDPSFSAASEFGECLVSFLPESCPAASGLADLRSSGDLAAGGSYSGDDPYDAAAGGLGAPGGGSDLTVSGILESMGGQCSVDHYAPDGAC